MGHLKDNAKALHRSSQTGASLVFAMCVCLAVLELSVNVALPAAMLLRSTAQSVTQEQCYYLASSFSSILCDDLTDSSIPEESVFSYVLDSLAQWQTDGTESFSVTAQGAEERITITLLPRTWETPMPHAGSFVYKNSRSAINRLEKENCFVRARFSVQISAALHESHDTCTDAYCLAERYTLQFFCGQTQLYWADRWYTDADCTKAFATDMPENTVIYYRYDTDSVTEQVIFLEGRIE